MSSIFTEYVRSLRLGDSPPDPGRFEELWDHLRGALTTEMKRRGVWNSSPSYLGVYGYPSWPEAAASRSALDELATECYAFVFLDRLRGLKAQARTRANIDGLIFLNIRNFLFDTQRKHDPLGFRIFEVVQSTVRELVRGLRLYVLEGPPEVKNETVLGFDPGARPARAWEVRLAGHVENWNDELLPDLVTGRGKDLEAVKTMLAARLCELPAQGLEVFRFKDLVDPLKVDVRSRWGSFFQQTPGAPVTEDAPEAAGEEADWARLSARVRPEDGFEARDQFEKLVSCMEASLQGLDTRRRTRDYLERLWSFLRAHAAEPFEAPSSEDGADELPSHRTLAKLLDIPRERLPGLYATLGGLLESCQGGSARVLPFVQGRSSGSGADPTAAWRTEAMDVTSRQEQLRQATGKALVQLAEAVPRRTGEAPRTGELYVVPATAEMGVEWAVIEAEPGDRGYLVVPADLHPLAGSQDVQVGRERRGGPLTLRCGFGVWVETGTLDPELRTGTLEGEHVDRARRLREQLLDGTVPAREVDHSPESEDWTTRVLLPAREALARPQPTQVRGRRPARRRFPYALAAALVAALGLSLWAVRLQRALERPLVDVPGYELAFLERGRGQGILEVPAEATHFALTLLLHRAADHERYVFSILDQDGRELWRSESLEPGPDEEHTVTFARRLLPDGDYRLRLYGETGEELTLLDEQDLHLRSAPGND